MLAVGALAALALVGARATYLGTVSAGDLSAQADVSNRDGTTLIAPRGAISTVDGRVLATDDLKVDVIASPDDIADPVGTARELAAVLPVNQADLEQLLSGGGKYAPVFRGLPLPRAERVRRLKLPGIALVDVYRRFLPAGPLAAQVVGLTDNDGAGISGIEAVENERLTGTPGRRVRVKDAYGSTLRVIADRDPKPGADLTLSLNSAIQDRTERILADVRREHGAKRAMAVVMDPRNGRVLALATVPGYDPNRRARLDQDLTRNRPVVDMFEPGSTFKIVTMSAALEEGKVTPDTTFDLPAVYRLYDREIKESHRDYDTTLTATQILEQSSNVGTVKIAELVGKNDLITWMKRFGFGSPTGIDFPGESAGYLRPADEWYGFSIGNIPIGQGVSVTLMQLARAYSAIANRGVLVTPRLVERVGDEAVPMAPGTRIMSTRTAREVDGMLRKVVSENGTGSAAAVRGFTVAGKTGTAQKYDEQLGAYSDYRYMASFVGYLPADNPQLVIAVAVDEPSSESIYGGDVAAPAFERIAEFATNTLGIEP